MDQKHLLEQEVTHLHPFYILDCFFLGEKDLLVALAGRQAGGQRDSGSARAPMPPAPAPLHHEPVSGASGRSARPAWPL